MVAVRTTDVAFIVMMAGPVITGVETLMDQMSVRIEDNSRDNASIEPAKRAWRKVLEAIASGEGLESAKAELASVYCNEILALPEAEREKIADVDQVAREVAEGEVAAIADILGIRYLLRSNPAPTLQQVKVPVLALYGELDKQVFPDSNSAAARAALESGSNSDFTVVIVPKANHLFQTAVTGRVDEYATLKEEFTPGFLETIYNWIVAHTQAQ
jgi:pimeloyl-ACP methyl ester carboxylesterase